MNLLYRIYDILQKSRLYKILRIAVVSAMLFVVALYASLYILLNLSSVQHAVRDIAQTELSKLLGAKVTIGNIAIHPFNEVVATDVSLTGNTNSDTILTVSKLGSSISL